MCKSSSILLSMMVLTGSMMYGNVGVKAVVSEPTNTEQTIKEDEKEVTVTYENLDYTQEGVRVIYNGDRKSVEVKNINSLETKIVAINVYGENGTVNSYTSTDGLGASGLVAGHNMKTGELDKIKQVTVIYKYNEYKFPTGPNLFNPEHNHTVEGKVVQRAAIALPSDLDLTLNGIKDTTFTQGATKNLGDESWTDSVFEITVHRNNEHPELSTVDIKPIKEGFFIIAVDGTDCWEGNGGGVTNLPVSQGYNVFYYYNEILKEDVPTTEGQKPETKPESPVISWGQIGNTPITGVDVAIFIAVSAGLAGLGFTVRKITKGNKNDNEE